MDHRTQQTPANARTRAWARLRRLVGLPPGAERRLVLQEAADLIERLQEEKSRSKK